MNQEEEAKGNGGLEFSNVSLDTRIQKFRKYWEPLIGLSINQVFDDVAVERSVANSLCFEFT